MVKYEDVIRPFPHCGYHINTTLDYAWKQIEMWDEPGVQSVEIQPEFQRAHVWTEEQQIKFMEFLLRNPNDSKAKSIMWNCQNWRFEVEDTKEANTIYLVDGLQRLTALKRFNNNEIPVYGYYLKDFENTLFMRRIHLDFYVASLSYKEMLQWYVDLNAGGTQHTKEEIDKVVRMMEIK